MKDLCQPNPNTEERSILVAKFATLELIKNLSSK